MKIGLVRHFKVRHPFPKQKLLSKQEVVKWFEGYDHSTQLEYKVVDLKGITWEHCYSSPMIRALSTVHYIYGALLRRLQN